ncbi:tetratricopeptide repeat protein [Nitrincola alkalilacustris]|uniref:tetratricopeptide repeat protein n=1 Tax=Nitrincola alkalilacustris TaxID=1571224 RepID=UPI001456FEB9|nr:tetratricopeptide repeat protein [Nitrincola alkalilacustris]
MTASASYGQVQGAETADGRLERLNQSFEAAMEQYRQRNYHDAYGAFDELSEQIPGNITVNLFLARSALELKRYDEALIALERVFIIDPDHAQARIEMARWYSVLNQPHLAVNELDIALRQELPDQVREEAEAFQRALIARQSRHSLTRTLVVGLVYDSNANNDIGGGSIIELPGLGNIGIMGNDEVRDYGLTQALILDHVYDFGLRGGWHWENRLTGLNRNNKKESGNDIFYLAVDSGPSYVSDNYKASFPVVLERVWLDYSTYLSSVSASAKYDHAVSSDLLLKASYRIQSLNYSSENSPRNALSNKVAVGFQRNFGVNPVTLEMAVSVEDRKQRSSSRYMTNPATLKELGMSVELSKLLNDKLRGSIGYSWRKTDYKETSFLFANSREDKVHRYDLGLTYALDRRSAIGVGVAYANHNSNQGPFDYDKTTAFVNYILRF